MISEEVRQSIAKYNQSHILKYYDEGVLSEEEKQSFEKQVRNFLFIDELDISY